MLRSPILAVISVTLILALGGVLPGCETTSRRRVPQPDVTKTLETDASNELTVKQGVPFALDLPGNSGTGYAWMIHGTLPEGLSQKGDPVFQADDPTRMGASGVTRFVLIGVHPGQYDLAFEMRRSWETDEPPVRRAIITLTVVEN